MLAARPCSVGTRASFSYRCLRSPVNPGVLSRAGASHHGAKSATEPVVALKIPAGYPLVLLDVILKVVSERQRRREIVNLTQREFCQEMSNPTSFKRVQTVQFPFTRDDAHLVRRRPMQRIIYFTNSAWFLYTYRLNLMLAMKSQGIEVIAAAPWEEKYARGFERHGIRLLNVPVRMWSTNPLGELAVVIHMLRLYRQERPDAVHCFALKANIYGSIAAHLAGVPVIINTFTGLGHTFIKGKLLQRIAVALLRLALKRPAWAIFQNPDDQRLFHDRGLARDRSTLILGSGIDTNSYVPSPEVNSLPSAEKKVRFLMFSKLLWSKGLREYVDAATLLQARLRATGHDGSVACVLLGGARKGNPSGVHAEWLGHPDMAPVEWLQDVAARGDVEWLSHDEEILRHIHEADVVVLPSYREGFPRSLLEGMACGKPIITTDVPGCREAVADGINGLLVPVKNADRLADAMLTLAEDVDLRRRMGQAGRERVVASFSDDMVISKTLDLYKRAGLAISRAKLSPSSAAMAR